MMRHVLAAALVVCALAPAAEAGRYLKSRKPIPGSYIVQFKDSISVEEIDRLADAISREHGGRLSGTLKHGIRGFGVRLTEAQARLLMNHPFIEQVEEDGEVYVSSESVAHFDFALAVPRDTATRSTSLASCPWAGSYYLCEYANDDYWVLDRIDNAGTLYGYKAYAYNSLGTGVRAYVVDSGIWSGHEEFEGRVEAGANMMLDPQVSDGVNSGTTEEPGVPTDTSPANDPCNMNHINYGAVVRHGTAVASVIGGSSTGVAKNVTLVPVKVISCNNAKGSKLALARGLDWIQDDMAARGGRGVVNISIFFDTATDGAHVCETTPGDPNSFTNCVSALEHEVTELVRKNIPVVTSANNQDNPLCQTSPARLGYGGSFPAPYHTITVGATTSTDTKLASSNFGSCVSIWAPGANLKVAVKTGTSSSDIVTQSGGTSFASAIVTGVVARLLQTYPTLSGTQVWTELVNRANQRSVQPPDFDPSTVTNTKLVYIPPSE